MYLSQTPSSLKLRDLPKNLEASYLFPGRLNTLAKGWFRKNQLGASSTFDPLTTIKQGRQISNSDVLLSSFATIGPFIPRLVARGESAAPLFTVTLQRASMELGGNEGMLYIGELPPTVNNASLTWVPVRRYSVAQGGMKAPADDPGEVCHYLAFDVLCFDPPATGVPHRLGDTSGRRLFRWSQTSSVPAFRV